MSHLVDAFLISRQADGCTRETIQWHRSSLKLFYKWLADHDHDTDPTTWNATLLRTYIVALQTMKTRTGKPYAKTSVTTNVQSLLAFTRWLHEEEFTDRNVGERVKKPRPPLLQKQPFSPEELKAILSTAKASGQFATRDYAIVCLLIDTGLRANELCNLRVTDLIMSQGILHVVEGKGNKSRIVPFSPLAGKAVAKYLAQRKSDSPYVFPSKLSEKFAPNSLLSLLKRIGERAGVADVHPHKFRHSFAIGFLRNHGDPITLQKLLGHSTLTMTLRYVNMNTDDLISKHQASSPLTSVLRARSR